MYTIEGRGGQTAITAAMTAARGLTADGDSDYHAADDVATAAEAKVNFCCEQLSDLDIILSMRSLRLTWPRKEVMLKGKMGGVLWGT